MPLRSARAFVRLGSVVDNVGHTLRGDLGLKVGLRLTGILDSRSADIPLTGAIDDEVAEIEDSTPEALIDLYRINTGKYRLILVLIKYALSNDHLGIVKLDDLVLDDDDTCDLNDQGNDQPKEQDKPKIENAERALADDESWGHYKNPPIAKYRLCFYYYIITHAIGCQEEFGDFHFEIHEFIGFIKTRKIQSVSFRHIIIEST